MSVAKRDNDVFRLTKTAEQAAQRLMPPKTVARPDRGAQTLALKGSWNEGTARGSDPYNSLGTRTRS